MTGPEAEYGERLRRALQAAADGIAPSRDGYERIHRRIARQPAQGGLGWLLGRANSAAARRLWISDSRLWLGDAWLLLTEGAARPAWRWLHGLMLRVWQSAALPAWRWLRDTWLRSLRPWLTEGPPERVRRWLGDGDGWLRPVLATAGAIFIAAAAVLAIPGLRQGIMEAGSVGASTAPKLPGSHQASVPGAVPRSSGHAVPIAPRRSPGSSVKPSASHRRGASPPATCPPSPGLATPGPTPTDTTVPVSTAGPCGTPTSGPTPSPSPSTSPSATPSDTATP
jgi:hypothetical protein